MGDENLCNEFKDKGENGEFNDYEKENDDDDVDDYNGGEWDEED